jgi:hypothetical protein
MALETARAENVLVSVVATNFRERRLIFAGAILPALDLVSFND